MDTKLDVDAVFVLEGSEVAVLELKLSVDELCVKLVLEEELTVVIGELSKVLVLEEVLPWELVVLSVELLVEMLLVD